MKRTKRGGRSHDRVADAALIVFLASVALGALLHHITVRSFTFSLDPLLLSGYALFALCGAYLLARSVYRRFLRAYEREGRFRGYRIGEEDRLYDMEAHEFATLVGWLFEAWGYRILVMPGVSGRRIDGHVQRGAKRYVVQVKKYHPDSLVGQPVLQQFFGSYAEEGYAGGFFVTTSDFTPPAKAFARSKRIELINGRQLVKHASRASGLPWYKLPLSSALGMSGSRGHASGVMRQRRGSRERRANDTGIVMGSGPRRFWYDVY